jgi:sarcosine oxidase subunit alpha
LTLADWTPVAKALVRAVPDGALAGRLGVACGRAALDDPQGVLVARFGPDEWLVLAAPGGSGAVVAGLEAVAGSGGDGELVSVIDLTSGRAAMRLTGERAPDVLAKVCGVDTGPASDGTAFRSLVAGVVAEVIRDDGGGPGGRSYLIACDWSLGGYLFETLVDAGAEFGLAVDRPLEWAT